MERECIAVIDFGGQYAHLIAKRIRHLGVYTRIFSPQASVSEVHAAKGIIFSGGPQSVKGPGAIPHNPKLLSLSQPLLGLCYGHQLMAHHFGGDVENLDHGEFGRTPLRVSGDAGGLLKGISPETDVWMSHRDTVVAPPPGFLVSGQTDLCPVAVIHHPSKPIYGVQFHPEVTDTPEGTVLLDNFIQLTGVERGWSMEAYVAEAMEEVKAQVGTRNVLMFLSGGVDSTVAYALLTKTLGTERVKGLLIDNGFLRKGEAEKIMTAYADLEFGNVDHMDASHAFLEAIGGKADPQEKRGSVGETFVDVRDTYLAGLNLDPEHWLLGQGTLYPDIIESGGTDHAEVIKTHHNRVGRVNDLVALGKVVEPLKELYKDEVRTLGTTLGLPDSIVWRHPFPGPGLSINVLCETGEEKFPENKEVDPLVQKILSQTAYTGALLPVRSVGVQGDSRTYNSPAAVVGPRDWDELERVSINLTNSVRGLNRVVTLLSPASLPELVPRKSFCTADRLDLLREADALMTQMLETEGLMRAVFQSLVILLPLSFNGQGESLVLRPVFSEDVMTARFARVPWGPLAKLCDALMALPGISAVFYDITHKPPATFGWE